METKDIKSEVNDWLKNTLGKDLPVRTFSVRFTDEAAKKRGYQIDFVVFYQAGCFAGGYGFESASARRNEQFTMVSLPIPFQLADYSRVPDYIEMKEISGELYPVEAAAHTPTNYKIGMFMGLYKNKFGVDYKFRGGDNNWAKGENTRIPAVVEEIDFYLTTDEYPIKGNKCITDYLKHYNAVVQMMAKKKTANKCPDEWDAAYYKTCWEMEDKTALHNYVAHLKSLGYIKAQTNTGKTIFKKEDNE